MLIGDAVLRSNPEYELIPLDRLESVERDLVASQADATHPPYGVLRPRPDSSMEPRVVSPDTALLFVTLSEPGPIPSYVRAGLGDRLATALGRLVLDGILEIEIDGVFRAGAAGSALTVGGPTAGRGGRTGELSEAAMRYGQSLVEQAPMSSATVAARLYMYGRRPVTPALRRQVAGGDLTGDASRILRRSWVERPPGSADSPWRNWQPRRGATRGSRPAISFKLYVSPTPETLSAAITAVATALEDAPGTLGFKVGRTVDGVARPDKMVAYFASLDELHRGARRVEALAGECRPHGVPFTAGVTDDGLLSWAIDPPSARGGRLGRASWRTWVTTRLAEYLLDARHAAAAADQPGEPWQVALARLGLDGVDTSRWVPDPGIFDYEAAG